MSTNGVLSVVKEKIADLIQAWKELPRQTYILLGASAVIHWSLRLYFDRKRDEELAKRKAKHDQFLAKKRRNRSIAGHEVLMSASMAKINLRKPVQLWNTVLFFPDPNPEAEGSPTQHLIQYFREAKVRIQICMYLASYQPLTDIIAEKYADGLLVQVITDYDTYTAHNNWGPKQWKRIGKLTQL